MLEGVVAENLREGLQDDSPEGEDKGRNEGVLGAGRPRPPGGAEGEEDGEEQEEVGVLGKSRGGMHAGFHLPALLSLAQDDPDGLPFPKDHLAEEAPKAGTAPELHRPLGARLLQALGLHGSVIALQFVSPDQVSVKFYDKTFLLRSSLPVDLPSEVKWPEAR